MALPQRGSVQVFLYHVARITFVKRLLFVLLWLGSGRLIQKTCNVTACGSV